MHTKFSYKMYLHAFYTLCVPGMDIQYRRYQIIPEGETPVPISRHPLCTGVTDKNRDRLCPEALASRIACPADAGVVGRKACSEALAYRVIL